MSELGNLIKDAKRESAKEVVKRLSRMNAKVDGEYVDCRDVGACRGSREYHVERAIRQGKFNKRFACYWEENHGQN